MLNLSYNDYGSKMTITLTGPLREFSNSTTNYLRVGIQNKDLINDGRTKAFELSESRNEIRTFDIDFYPKISLASLNLTLTFDTNVRNSTVLRFFIDSKSVDIEIGVISAIVILIFFNILVNAEVILTLMTMLCVCV